MRLDQAMHSVDGQAQGNTYVAQILRFFNGVFIFLNNCSVRVLPKLTALHGTDRQHAQKLDATGGQSHTNCSRVAASRMQIVPEWPPVACNMNKIDGNLPVNGGHSGTICMPLASTQVHFVCESGPLRYISRLFFASFKTVLLDFHSFSPKLKIYVAIC